MLEEFSSQISAMKLQHIFIPDTGNRELDPFCLLTTLVVKTGYHEACTIHAGGRMKEIEFFFDVVQSFFFVWHSGLLKAIDRER